jgi:hypothetical protein
MKKFKSYSKIIEHYRWNGRLKSIEEIEWIKTAPSLEKAIELAGTSRQENGKLSFHQRWLDENAAALGIKELLSNLQDIEKIEDFDLLVRFVDVLVGNIPGLKEMFVYDVAFRMVPTRTFGPFACISTVERGKAPSLWASTVTGHRSKLTNCPRVPNVGAARDREPSLHS